MKKLSSMMRVLSVLAVCAAMMVPSVVSAGMVSRVLMDGDVYEPGRYTLNLNLTEETKYLEFEVVNGDGSGQNMVSSVKIALRDGKKKIVIISPGRSRQKKFSNAFGTLGEDVIKGLTEITLDIKVRGPKKYRNRFSSHKFGSYKWKFYKADGPKWYSNKANDHKKSSMKLNVTEYYEEAAEACVELHWMEIGYPRCPR